MHYKALNNSLHFLSAEDIAVGGESWLPAGCVRITDAQAEALRPKPSAAAIIEFKKEAVRVVREGILNRLAGIATDALITGDTATTAAYVAVRQGLLAITADWPTDPDQIEALVATRYFALRAQCTPQMVDAFAQVDA